MIDHLSLFVSDFARSRDFYVGALAPLGYEQIVHLSREQIPHLPAAHILGLGVKGKPDLWLRSHEGSIDSVHLAFAAANRAEVDAFFRAALDAGGKSHGEPGLRPLYHANYYGAFVLDPDGHNIEAVCHLPA